MTSDDRNERRVSLSVNSEVARMFAELERNLGIPRERIFKEALESIRRAEQLSPKDQITNQDIYREVIPLLSARDVSDERPTESPIADRNDPSQSRSSHRFSSQDLINSAPGLYLDRFHRQASENFELSTASVIIPVKKETAGVLIQSIPLIWNEMIDYLQKDWGRIYELPPEKFEELIAGTFHRDGYDEVVLTPRSRDHGRDVIAIRNGIGCVKIIGSVKRYAKNNRVRHDDVRALLGVLSGEQNSSKGMIVTTSDFQPGVYTDPYIKNFLPTRLELMNWVLLRKWLLKIRNSKNNTGK